MSKLRVLTILGLMTYMLSMAFTPNAVTASGACPTSCAAGLQLKIDFYCQREKILNPSSDRATSCCLNYCEDPSTPYDDVAGSLTLNVNFFGVTLRLNNEKRIAQLIYLVFNTFLGLVAAMAGFLSVYAGWQRARVQKDEDISKNRALINNLVWGFVIIGVSFGIVQLVANFFQLGSLSDIITFDFQQVLGR